MAIHRSYRGALPQLNDGLFFADGGLETTLVFHHGINLPHFAAVDMHRSTSGEDVLLHYFRRYLDLATAHGVGFILESATWRASPDWAEPLGLTADALARLNLRAIELLEELRAEYRGRLDPVVISGCIGPRGDGYSVDRIMNAAEAQDYHAWQIELFARSSADMVSAITMTYAEEAVGVTRAARAAGMPAVISFTVETDGRLPSGQSLRGAIEQVERDTDRGPAYYMINCAHPTHFQHALDAGEEWVRRIRGVRANASTKSHAELDEAEVLDEGDPIELGAQYRTLRERFGQLNVLGGCCGTDHRHVAAIGAACTAAQRAA